MRNHRRELKFSPQISGLLLFLLLAITGCSSNQDSSNGCLDCHEMELGASHQFDCNKCHGGNTESELKEEAHASLIALPSHPAVVEKVCGSCHAEETKAFQTSLHLTQRNLVNTVRVGFGADLTLNSLQEIPISLAPQNSLELADDMLRRRCLRCHLYSNGDNYPATHHGTGCSGCHLLFENGSLTSHVFTRQPSDTSCLSCHYGNRVGFDYYGRFEHDFHEEYRTPFFKDEHSTRPYGVEYHQLQPDVHQIAGMSCIDCHGSSELMHGVTTKQKITCNNCHNQESLNNSLPEKVTKEEERYFLTSAQTGKVHEIPLMLHPAHQQYGESVVCQVCHAQWSFNDSSTHLIRSDLDEYDHWHSLFVQGSSEIEKFLLNNLDYDKDEFPPLMSDKLSGEMRPGVWYKSYGLRRWEDVPIGRNETGQLTTVRPIMNLHLSWLTEDEETVFDSLQPLSTKRMVPYVPHTTGPAGLFYKQRIQQFLKHEKISREQN